MPPLRQQRRHRLQMPANGLNSGLPMLAGMAATFAAVATLAAVGGWAVEANEYGRVAAIVLLALFGLTLLFRALSNRLTRPLVALGSRLSETAGQGSGSNNSAVFSSVLLGIATGLLWAPCAGPILGLILTGAALNGADAQTSLLLAAYAAGAATSLALALLIGGRVFAAMKRSLGIGGWVRRGLGAAVLAGVAVIASGLDIGVHGSGVESLASSGDDRSPETYIWRQYPTVRSRASDLTRHARPGCCRSYYGTGRQQE
jgi:cytochrome c biogenesis protein CcdA